MYENRLSVFTWQDLGLEEVATISQDYLVMNCFVRNLVVYIQKAPRADLNLISVYYFI